MDLSKLTPAPWYREYRIERRGPGWGVFDGEKHVAWLYSQEDAQLFVWAKQTQTMCGPIKFVMPPKDESPIFGINWEGVKVVSKARRHGELTTPSADDLPQPDIMIDTGGEG